MTVIQGWTGRVFEDFEVGDVYQHALGRTVIAAATIWFTLVAAGPTDHLLVEADR